MYLDIVSSEGNIYVLAFEEKTTRMKLGESKH